MNLSAMAYNYKKMKPYLHFALLNFILLGTIFVFHLDAYLPYHAPKNTLFLILTVLSLDIYCISKIQRIDFTLFITPLELILAIRFMWAVVTNPGMIIHPSDLEFWILLGLTILAIVSRQIISDTETNEPKGKIEFYTLFIRIIWITGLVQAIIGMGQWLLFAGYPNPLLKTPMIGTIGMPNGYGLFIAISAVAAFIDLRKQTNWKLRILVAMSLIFMLTSLVLNRSRGAILGLIITGFILFLNSIKATRKTIVYSFIVFLIVGCSLILFLYQINPESAEGRLMVWRISIPMCLDHPLLGVGQGNFAKEYLNYQARFFQNPQNINLAYKAGNLKQAHNEYLQAFCETGIIGGLLFFSLWLFPLVSILFLNKKNNQYSMIVPDIVFLLIPILVHSMVDTPLHVLSIAVLSYMIIGFIPLGPKYWIITLRDKKIKWAGLIIVFVVSLFVIIKCVYQYPAYVSWGDGVRNTSEQRWQQAIADYSDALQRLPDKGELQFYLGSAMVMDGQYSKGIYYLNQSLNGFNDRNIYLSLSLAHMKLRHYDIAEHYAKKALSMFPDHLAPHLWLGQIYYYQGKLEESKNELRKCILRDTAVQSDDVQKISDDAAGLWKQFFGQPF